MPNVLLIMADQLSDAWLDVAHTPALDRLADRGVRFRNAYANSPLCAPARYAMLTGQLNSKIGAYDNASELPSSLPTVAHRLRSAGYQTSLIGKMHFVGPDQLHGFEERLTTDIYPADYGWTPDWSRAGQRVDWWFHNMDSVTNAGIVDSSNQLDFDDEVAHQAIRKVRDLARSDDERPWFLTVSFTHPHDPYAARKEFWDLYEHDSIPMPVSVRPAEPDPHSRRLARVMESDEAALDDEEIRRARHAYLANVSYIDSLVGELLTLLERLEMSDNTLILFTSDHGDMLGEKGLWYKMSFFEHSARIPLIMNGPGTTPKKIDTPVSLLDVLPTLLEAAGTEPDSEADGSSLFAVAEGQHSDRTVLGEYLGEGAIAPVFMLRRNNMKFIWSAPDPPQLYNLVDDPTESVNLAPTSGELDAWIEEIHETWDVEAIDESVRRSQRHRRIVDDANRQGVFTPWDHQPHTDASEQYMRNHLDLNEVESKRRR